MLTAAARNDDSKRLIEKVSLRKEATARSYMENFDPPLRYDNRIDFLHEPENLFAPILT